MLPLVLLSRGAAGGAASPAGCAGAVLRISRRRLSIRLARACHLATTRLAASERCRRVWMLPVHELWLGVRHTWASVLAVERVGAREEWVLHDVLSVWRLVDWWQLGCTEGRISVARTLVGVLWWLSLRAMHERR